MDNTAQNVCAKLKGVRIMYYLNQTEITFYQGYIDFFMQFSEINKETRTQTPQQTILAVCFCGCHFLSPFLVSFILLKKQSEGFTTLA